MRRSGYDARYAELHHRTVASIATFIDEVYRRRGETPPRPVAEMAIVGLAHSTGVVTELMADPDIEPTSLINATVAGLAPTHNTDRVEGRETLR